MIYFQQKTTDSTMLLNRRFTMDMLAGMPEEKKRVLVNALRRNSYLTSYFGLSLQTVSVYKEGWYIEFDGCRSAFHAWVGDNDGEFVFGKRKPKEEKLHYLYAYNPNLSEIDFSNFAREFDAQIAE